MNQRTSTTILLLLAIAAAPAHGQENAEPARPLTDSEIASAPLAAPETQANERGAAGVFLRAAGSNFIPRDSTSTFSYTSAGCLQRDSNTGDSFFTYDIQVPHGAMIDYFRLYYFDGSGTYNLNSELWSFDGAGGATLIAEADSTGDAGFGSIGSGFFSHVVNTNNESLSLVVSLQGGVGSQIRLCGIRIRYQSPGVFADRFETADTTARNTTVESD